MHTFVALRRTALAVILAAALASPALADSARIRFHGGSVGFIAGVHWGSGILYYHKRKIPVRVSGLQVGTIGRHSFDAEGVVHGFHRLSDIAGTYAAIGAGATAGVGAGALTMQNGNGASMDIH